MAYILLVEDNAMVARTTLRIFGKRPHRWAADDQGAIDALEEDANVAVLICDWSLDNSAMNADELLPTIFQRWPHLAQRTVVMSGHAAQVQDWAEARGLGFLRKPASLKSLRDLVDRHLEKFSDD